MGTKHCRFHCSFTGEMSIVHTSYPVRAAKPSPAKRFAVAALTAVPNPKYRIYVGGRSSHVWYLCIYFPFPRPANPRPDPRENPEPKEMPPPVRLVGERRRRTKFCTSPSSWNIFYLRRHANDKGHFFPIFGIFIWHLGTENCKINDDLEWQYAIFAEGLSGTTICKLISQKDGLNG